MEKNDHFAFTRYVKEGAKSVFVSFGGGFGSEIIAPLIIKYSLPVFVGRTCASACTIISTSSPTLYASDETMFMFHEGREQKGWNMENYRNGRQWINSMYRKAGATDEFIDLAKNWLFAPVMPNGLSTNILYILLTLEVSHLLIS